MRGLHPEDALNGSQLVKRVSTADQSASPAKQLAAFIARFDPAVAKLVRAARSALRNDCPPPSNRSTTITTFSPLASAVPSVRLHRLLGGFCEGSRPLVLLRGHAARSQSDPARHGNQNRYVRLQSAGTLAEPAVAALLRAAVAQAKTPLPETGRGYTVIKSVSAKQRPRRPPSSSDVPSQ